MLSILFVLLLKRGHELTAVFFVSRVHQNIQNLFLKKEIKPTFPKREMLFTAGIQEHYKMGLFLILIFKRVSLNVILSFGCKTWKTLVLAVPFFWLSFFPEVFCICNLLILVRGFHFTTCWLQCKDLLVTAKQKIKLGLIFINAPNSGICILM